MKDLIHSLFLLTSTILWIYLFYKANVAAKDHTKAIIDEVRSSSTNTQAMLNKPVKRGQGRPKGSKNKATMKRGR